MDELKASPIQRPWAKSVANALRGVRDFADKATIPESVPLLGGSGVGELILGQTPEGFDRVAYGEPLTTGKGWTTKLRPEAVDMAFTGLDVAPVAKGVTKALRKGADAASTAAVRKITGNPMATPHGVIDEAVQMSPVSQIFAGQKSKGANLNKLKQAQQMVGDDVDLMSQASRDAYQKTGWFRGADNGWRYEIDDRPAFTANGLTPKINKAAERLGEKRLAANEYGNGLRRNMMEGNIDWPNAQQMWRDRYDEFQPERDAHKKLVDTQGDMYQIGQTRRTSDLTAFLRHPELQESYPGVNRLTAETMLKPGMEHSKEGYYSQGRGHVGMVGKTDKDVRQGMLHELQHYVQGQEGFARGGSQEEFTHPEFLAKKNAENQIAALNLKMHDALQAGDKDAYMKFLEERDALVPLANKDDADIITRGYENYRRLAGEAESRAVEKRQNYTTAQRKKTFPLDDYDIPLDQLIIKEQR